MIRTTLLVTAMLAASHSAIAGDDTRAGSVGSTPSRAMAVSGDASPFVASSSAQAKSSSAQAKSKTKRKKISSQPKSSNVAAASSSTSTSLSPPQSATAVLATPDTALARATPSTSTPAPLPTLLRDSTSMPVIAQNATVSVSPIRATMPAAVDANEKSAAPFRPKTTVKARIDDGRYSGFHQGGGDQPAGDQQIRPADRIQTENQRLSRGSGERAPAPPQAGSTPAMRDQSTIVRTQ